MLLLEYFKNRLPPDGPKLIKEIVVLFMVLSTFVFWSGIYWRHADKIENKESIAQTGADSVKDEDEAVDNCNVAGINLHGGLVTYISEEQKSILGKNESDSTASENVLSAIRSAEDNDKIKATILEIDSYGGNPVAGEEIATALKRAKKPTVVFIRSAGASAAYMAATGAQTIFASKFSDVGSIGVTISYTDNSVKNNKDGFTFNQLSIGKYKDMGNPDKPVTEAEKQLIMRDLNIVQDNFIKIVSENRKIDLEAVRKIADGSTMLGDMALKNKLVDRIGNYFDVLDFVSSTIGVKPEVCWY